MKRMRCIGASERMEEKKEEDGWIEGWRNEQEVLKRKIEKEEKRRGGCRSVESSEIERKRGGEKEKK